jgi:hypothetical protein
MDVSMHRAGKSSDMWVSPRALEPASSTENATSPCFGCHNQKRCAVEEIACEAYRVATMRNVVLCPPSVWEGKSREPTEAIYKRVWNYFPGQL